MTDADVETIMEACLKDTGLTFEVVDEVVIVKPAVQVMNSVPQKKMVLSGTVKDNRGDVMPGVTVRIKGTTLGVATDIDGKWNLEIPEMNDVVLVFSFVGMESQEIEPGNRTVIDVVMEVAKENLEEVVVTGIFKRNKEGFTGSATQVSGDEIKKMTAGNVLKALEMLDPGLNTSNLAGSNPNAIPDFQMRGQASLGNYEANDVVVLRGDVNTRPNQPLFVLDGVIGVDATTIMDLDPAQVESITLLKDAAATVIYGSEAANGVVVVETKAPVPGKLRFTYNGNYGLEWPDLSVYDLMNAGEKLRVEELAGYYANKDDVGLQNYYNHLKQEVLRGVDTYWLGEPVQTAFSHRHGLTVEGGDRALRYKIYLGAKWDPGVMKETNLNTKTGKIDLNYRQNKILINNSLTVDYSDGTRESPYGTFQDYAIVNPYYRKTDENGNIKEGVEELVMGDLRNSFRPEFLNRLDEIIMFKPLNKDNIGSIINLLINDVNRRLEDKELKVVLSDTAKDYIVDHGFDPMYGARPLKRYVQKSVETLAAKLILAGDVSTGDKILIDCENGTLVAKDMKS